MTDKMRKEFEAWYFRRFSMTDLTGAWAMERWEAWVEAWMASRAAIEVELPEGFTHHGASDQTEYVLEAGSVKSAIESLGLKVKP